MKHRKIGELSEYLEPFRNDIQASVRKYIKITPYLSKKKSAPKQWNSRYRGFPYLPKNRKYPVDNHGKHLAFLAQINFSEVPNMDYFPKSGILQIFISDDDSYGMTVIDGSKNPRKYFNGLRKQEKFKVVFYDKVMRNESRLVHDFSTFLPDFDNLPVDDECELQFSMEYEAVGYSDYCFDNIFGEEFFENFGRHEVNVLTEYTRKFNDSMGSKIGGYASFVQGDPRVLSLKNEDWILLLQIGDGGKVDIMWGDGGVGNFFINKIDLKKQDFTKVIYYWDCG